MEMGKAEALDKAWLVGRGREIWETTNYGVVIDGDGDNDKLYYLIEIFDDKSNLYDLKYGTGRATSFRIAAASLIRSTWEHVLPYPLP